MVVFGTDVFNRNGRCRSCGDSRAQHQIYLCHRLFPRGCGVEKCRGRCVWRVLAHGQFSSCSKCPVCEHAPIPLDGNRQQAPPPYRR